jgi:hypothetical protein
MLVDIEDYRGRNMPRAALENGSGVAGDQPEDQDDRQGNPDGPEKNRTHASLHIVLGDITVPLAGSSLKA